MKYPSYRSSGLPLNITVLTEQTNITSRHSEFKSPGWLNHQANVASEAKISSTYMPAALITIRRQRLSISQASETLQYMQGVNTSSIKPSSWQCPPKCRQASPCPSS